MQWLRDLGLVVAIIAIAVNSGLDFRSGQGHLQSDAQVQRVQMNAMSKSIDDLYEGVSKFHLRSDDGKGKWLDREIVFTDELDVATEPLAGITGAQLQAAVKLAWHDEDGDQIRDVDENGNVIDICPNTDMRSSYNRKGCSDLQVLQSCIWDASKSMSAKDQLSGMVVGTCKNAEEPDKPIAYPWEWKKIEGKKNREMTYGAPVPWEPPAPAKDDGAPAEEPPKNAPPTEAPKTEPVKDDTSKGPKLP